MHVCQHQDRDSGRAYTLYLGFKPIIDMTNQSVVRMAKDLRKASAKNDAPIWARLAAEALKPSIARRRINLKRIGQLTKDDDTVVFPGKVLGTGNVPHKITLCSFSISNSAASKIVDGGGRLVRYTDLIEQNPTGSGVVLLG